MMVPPGKSRVECEELVLRFISTLSWVEERGFMVEGGGVSGGNLPRPMGRDKEFGLFSICDEFDLSYFPEATDEKAMLALGLMREGRGINHVGYAFLSFYRVLEVAFSTNSRRLEWITATLDGLTGFNVKEALDGIRAQGIVTPEAISRHLFQSGRCAMAHANRKPIVDPDNPSDMRRLGSELPIMRELAIKAIEEVFGVETRDTNFHKHHYELAGFKEVLGPDLVDKLKRGETVTDAIMVNIPDISVRIRKRDPYPPLNNLRCKGIGQAGKLCHLFFEALGGDVQFRFSLDFGEERIDFDLFDDVSASDTGTAKSAERVGEVRRFQQDYFGNGQLHIVNADTGALIGRKDAYLPTKMYLDGKSAKAERAHWKALALQRREPESERERRFWKEIERNTQGYDVSVTLSSSG
jgi:hypothetical protein